MMGLMPLHKERTGVGCRVCGDLFLGNQASAVGRIVLHGSWGPPLPQPYYVVFHLIQWEYSPWIQSPRVPGRGWIDASLTSHHSLHFPPGYFRPPKWLWAGWNPAHSSHGSLADGTWVTSWVTYWGHGSELTLNSQKSSEKLPLLVISQEKTIPPAWDLLLLIFNSSEASELRHFLQNAKPLKKAKSLLTIWGLTEETNQWHSTQPMQNWCVSCHDGCCHSSNHAFSMDPETGDPLHLQLSCALLLTTWTCDFLQRTEPTLGVALPGLVKSLKCLGVYIPLEPKTDGLQCMPGQGWASL